MAAAGHILSVDDLAAIAGRNPGLPRRVPFAVTGAPASSNIVPAVPDRFLWCDDLIIIFNAATFVRIVAGLGGSVLCGASSLAGQFPHRFERNIYTEDPGTPITLDAMGGALADFGGFAIVRTV